MLHLLWTLIPWNGALTAEDLWRNGLREHLLPGLSLTWCRAATRLTRDTQEILNTLNKATCLLVMMCLSYWKFHFSISRHFCLFFLEKDREVPLSILWFQITTLTEKHLKKKPFYFPICLAAILSGIVWFSSWELRKWVRLHQSITLKTSRENNITILSVWMSNFLTVTSEY